MKIINTFKEISSCFQKGIFSIEAWRKYVGNISPELCEKCESDASEYDFHNAVLPIINCVLNYKEKSARAEQSFISVTARLKNSIGRLFESEPVLDIILYLGLCNGAGWATSLDGREAILIGIEKVVELNWQDEESMQALIFHEIGHIWHKICGNLYPEARSGSESSMVQLYQEGIAMTCEHILCGDDSYYHQNINGWLDWCNENKSEIKKEYLRRINNNENNRGFFGDWCSYKGHSDVGYFLGCEFIKFLLNKFSLTETANLSVKDLMEYYKIFALQG